MGNLVWYGNTGNTGLLTSSPLTLMTTEIQGVLNNAVTISTNAFSITNTGGAVMGEVFLNLGNPGIGSSTANSSSCSGWFLPSYDGVNFESTTVAPSRNPSFVISLPTVTTISANVVFKASKSVKIPSVPFKVMILNSCGQTFGSGSTMAPFLILAPFTVQKLA